MTAAGDDRYEMADTDILSDDAIEAFLTGEPHPGWQQDAALSAIDAHVAAVVARPTPPVGAALARLMRPAAVTAPTPTVVDGWTRPVAVPAPTAGWAPDRRHRPRALRLVAGVGAGLAVASVALPVAAATHVLPRPAHQAVVQVLEAVTPFDFDVPAAPPVHVPATPTTSATVPAGSPAATAGGPAVPAPPPSTPAVGGLPAGGPPPSTPSGIVPAQPGAARPGASPTVPGGPPAGVDPGPPAGTSPGPPSGVDAGPPTGITPGPPAGLDRPGAPGRAVAGSTPAAGGAGAAAPVTPPAGPGGTDRPAAAAR